MNMDFEAYKRFNPRLRFLYLISGLLLVILVSGLAYRQLWLSSRYREQEKQQSMRRILRPGLRGAIYDREGRALVTNRPSFSAVVYLNELRPEFRREYIALVREARAKNQRIDRRHLQVRARHAVAQRYLDQINIILGRSETVNPRNIERHFNQNLLLPLTLVRELPIEDYALLIEQIPIESPIQIHSESVRHYPYGPVASHTLGYVVTNLEVSADAMPGDNLATFRFKGTSGNTGVERQFNDYLQGASGGEIWIVDPFGFQFELVDSKIPALGKNLTISLDVELQIQAEKAFGKHSGAAVVLDVKTGEVYAMVSKPNYDLNDFSPFIPTSVWTDTSKRGALLNRAIQGLYPAGSSFKLLTAIAALKSGVIRPDTQVDCPGSFTVGRRKFLCHNKTGHGQVDLKRAISQSCNVFFYSVGLQTGIKKLAAEARNFGFHKPTGIELPAETHYMLVPDPPWKKKRYSDNWYPGDTVNFSIGQGFFLTTPLQMASFAASIARNETLTKPTILYDSSLDPDKVRHGGLPIGLSDAQYRRIIDGMELAVQAGTARLARMPGIRLAAKTGTAQVFVEGEELTLAWFIGFAPVEDPQVAIAIMIPGTDPNDNYHGGSTAGPIAKTILEAYFRKYPAPSTNHLATNKEN